MITENVLKALEFDKIQSKLGTFCMGPLGKSHVRDLVPMVDAGEIGHQLSLVAAYHKMQEEDKRFPLHGYDSVSEELEQLKVEGFVLSVESVMRLRQLFENIMEILKFFTARRIAAYPQLGALIDGLYSPGDWLDAINRLIDREGEIKPDASSELKSISRAIQQQHRELDGAFRKELAKYRDLGFLAETHESVRNNRRVLSVLSEHKRKINGIIHDESSTGRTSFIEPATIVRINNEIVELEIEFKKEVYKLLKLISTDMHPHAAEIGKMYALLGQLDFIRAKAELGKAYRGAVPEVVGHAKLEIVAGYHPLLVLKNEEAGKETVPFDLVLHAPNRLLLLSGPNAGGKSILMKAVGLLQVMAQSGLMIPVDQQSVFGIFHKVFIDIGDQQSIESELSTYSSHLQNMKRIMTGSDDRSLVLIDEFGSGTDPKLGAAIAETMLWALNRKRITGVITTHYPNLKAFAYKTKGIVNGAMVFDREAMEPTYKLMIGRPGSSFTFEIAERSGLPASLIKQARTMSGKSLRAMEDLIMDMEKKQRTLEDKLDRIEQREKRLDQLVRNYERMAHELDVKRKKFRLERKEADYKYLADANREMEKLVRELKQSQSLEKAKDKLKEIKGKKKAAQEEVVSLNESVRSSVTRDVDISQIKVGSFVRLQNGTTTGRITEIDRKEAFVQVGDLTMRVKVRDLVPVAEPVVTRGSTSIQADVTKDQKFESKLDIRGMRVEDALANVQQFLDEALLANALHVRIIHGKGSGILRKIVQGKLKEYPIANAYHPEHQNGGEGVTIIEF